MEVVDICIGEMQGFEVELNWVRMDSFKDNTAVKRPLSSTADKKKKKRELWLTGKREQVEN